jgi:hypothetical protein
MIVPVVSIADERQPNQGRITALSASATNGGYRLGEHSS